MLVRKFEDVAAQPMDLPGATGVKMRLMIGRDDGAPNFAMRHFEVAPGGHTPLHKHNYEHEVLVLEGKGLVTCDHGNATHRQLSAGQVVFIPPNQTHQFRNTGETPLRFICLVPTTFDCGTSCETTPGT